MRSLVMNVAFVLVFVLPAVAQAPSKPSPSPTPSSAASPKPSPSPGAAKASAAKNQVVGTIVSVDEATSTITFKDPKEQTTTWKVEGRALGRLKTLKAGDKVKILYSVDEKGAPKAAVAIRPTKGKKGSETD